MFSLVLPAYNEAERLERCVEVCLHYLDSGDEIIIAEDGSTDNTADVGRLLEKKYNNVTFVHHDDKLGRGGAFRNIISIAKGDRMGFIDVDMATDMKYFPKLLELSKKYDVVTGSRYIKGAKVDRPGLRFFVSKTYNFLIRLFVGVKVFDAQCGFKAFSRKFVDEVLVNVEEKTWAWDSVLIVECVKRGYSFMEFPVEWVEGKDARHSASFGRIFNDVKIHGRVLLQLFLKWRIGLNV